jgi:4-amino-4-deoxy-L-arabinose transferase-like glycosyltransferase
MSSRGAGARDEHGLHSRVTLMPEPAAAPAVRAANGMASRWEWLAPCFIITHIVLSWLARATQFLTNQDDARYFLLARAIRSGTYRDQMWPGAPLHHMYPPGYPAVLAAWTAIGGEAFDWMIGLQLCFVVATLVLLYLAVRRVLGLALALCALGVLAVNPMLLEASGQVFSDGALALCFMLAVWASTAMARSARQTWVLLIAALASPLIRSAGVALPAALVMYLLWQRRFRDAAVIAAVCGVVVGALLWWTLSDPNAVAGSSYAGDIAFSSSTRGAAAPAPSFAHELLARVATNLRFYATRGLPWILPQPLVAGTMVDNVIGQCVLAIVLPAGVWRAWRLWPLATLLLLCTAVLVCVWPYQVPRYLVPVLPVIVVIVLLGVVTVSRALRRSPEIPLALATILIGFGGLTRSVAAVGRGAMCGPDASADTYNCMTGDQAAFFRAAEYARDSLPADARILSAKSEPLHVYSTRITAPLARVAPLDSAAFWHALAHDSVTDILLGDMQWFERQRLAPLLATRCHDVVLTRQFSPRMQLFHLAPASARVGTPACAAVAAYLALPSVE